MNEPDCSRALDNGDSGRHVGTVSMVTADNTDAGKPPCRWQVDGQMCPVHVLMN